jgi:hypothetical protein
VGIIALFEFNSFQSVMSMEDLEDVILNCQGDDEFGELLMFKDQVSFACDRHSDTVLMSNHNPRSLPGLIRERYLSSHVAYVSHSSSLSIFSLSPIHYEPGESQLRYPLRGVPRWSQPPPPPPPPRHPASAARHGLATNCTGDAVVRKCGSGDLACPCHRVQPPS